MSDTNQTVCSEIGYTVYFKFGNVHKNLIFANMMPRKFKVLANKEPL